MWAISITGILFAIMLGIVFGLLVGALLTAEACTVLEAIITMIVGSLVIFGMVNVGPSGAIIALFTALLSGSIFLWD